MSALMSAIGGKADIICRRKFLLMTQSDIEAAFHVAVRSRFEPYQSTRLRRYDAPSWRDGACDGGNFSVFLVVPRRRGRSRRAHSSRRAVTESACLVGLRRRIRMMARINGLRRDLCGARLGRGSKLANRLSLGRRQLRSVAVLAVELVASCMIDVIIAQEPLGCARHNQHDSDRLRPSAQTRSDGVGLEFVSSRRQYHGPIQLTNTGITGKRLGDAQARSPPSLRVGDLANPKNARRSDCNQTVQRQRALGVTLRALWRVSQKATEDAGASRH